MSIAQAKRACCVALVGNPNTGKSTLFNALAGANQRVGNYPGVTVEKKLGHATWHEVRFTLIDLPGTYSLAPRSPDEMVTVDVLLGRREDTERPDVVLCVIDASNIDRNFYLLSQLLELDVPAVVALNMTDVAAQHGVKLDVKLLAERLGIEVVPVQANKRVGLDELRAALVRAVDCPVGKRASPLPAQVCEEVDRLHAEMQRSSHAADMKVPRYLAERLLLDTSGYLEPLLADGQLETLHGSIAAARERLATASCPVPAIEAIGRYGWISQVVGGAVTRPAQRATSWTDRLDRVLTHRFFGLVAFVLMMFVIFQAVFQGATPLMDLIESGVGAVGALVAERMPEGALRSLVVDGLIAGVGGVLVFLPQIVILFFFVGILEDCGYMARSAYLMDKLMVRVGLSGKSFIPLLSSFACAIPGIMATRVIENRRDRITTILVAPLMSCSARLPVYTLLIAAFIPQRRWLGVFGLQAIVMMSMYLLGMVVAVAVAVVLKKTLLRGPTPPFVLELPAYKWPSPRTVIWRMVERGWAFVQGAGTMILAVSVVIWAMLYFPHSAEVGEPYQSQIAVLEAKLPAVPEAERGAIEEQISALNVERASAYRKQSYLGRIGHLIEPAVRPLGWDWRIGCAAIASLPAREVVVATLGIIYSVGEDVDLDNEADRGRLVEALHRATWDDTDRPVFNVPVALSIMVFFSLCAQCWSTLMVIKRETNSWGWPALTFGYMTTLAYVASLVTYQVGIRLM
ncbi:MAG: ferrous iron transport protein B [Planctomycetes bacterium]|nr:ferrous iron transport protein B [Planctomycetota bacterium]